MKIVFPVDLYKKLKAYINGINYEISGLGKIRVIGKDIHVVDLRIFKQTVTGASTKIDQRALSEFYNQLIDEGEDLSAWKLWWHSHADMDAFFSSIDVATIDDFDTEMKEDNWMLSVVGNHKGDFQMRVDIYAPIRCTIPDLDYEISYDDEKLEDKIFDEITEKVTIQKFYTPPTKVRKKNSIDWRNPNNTVLSPGGTNTSNPPTILTPEQSSYQYDLENGPKFPDPTGTRHREQIRQELTEIQKKEEKKSEIIKP